METIAQMILAAAGNDRAALMFEGRSWTYREYVQACIERAHLLLKIRAEGPFHVGILLDNVPEYPMLLGAAALAGAAVVGINPTRRGAGLARDIRHSDCQILITEESHLGEVEGLDLPVLPERRFIVDSQAWYRAVQAQAGRPAPGVPIDPAAPYLLLFTSGTTGDPKAALCSQGRLAFIGLVLSQMQEITPDDVTYMAMPFFHSNALMAGWSPTLAAGAAGAIRRRFSASGFLPDIRRYGCTYMNYVGKPLSYILATPERPEDWENPLRRCFGNEATPRDISRFEQRFGCRVTDGYGSTEGGIAISRTPDTPQDALGIGEPGIKILDPETEEECPRGRFDEHGRLLNADEAIGEIANAESASGFEGYWNDLEAARERTRGGIYWSGDLGYRDEKGFIHFAGRTCEWLRVDGENFAAAPIESILMRHPDVVLAAVYAVPNVAVGDDVMAALTLRGGCQFDGVEFAEFLSAQSDLGTKWAPRYVRVARHLPVTATNKILKRELSAQIWECDDPVYWREKAGPFRLLEPADLGSIRKKFAAHGRADVIELQKT